MRKTIESLMRTTPLLVVAAALVLGTAGCFVKQAMFRPPEDAEDVVEEFMDAMVDEDEEGLMDLISPAWLERNKVDPEEYTVNKYFPDDYEILGADGRDIKVRIDYESGGARYMWFRVVEEDDELFIVPGSFDDEWIHPWQKTEEVK